MKSKLLKSVQWFKSYRGSKFWSRKMAAPCWPQNISFNNSINNKLILMIKIDFEKARQAYSNKLKIIKIGSVEQKLLKIKVLGGHGDGIRVLYKLRATI